MKRKQLSSGSVIGGAFYKVKPKPKTSSSSSQGQTLSPVSSPNSKRLSTGSKILSTSPSSSSPMSSPNPKRLSNGSKILTPTPMLIQSEATITISTRDQIVLPQGPVVSPLFPSGSPSAGALGPRRVGSSVNASQLAPITSAPPATSKSWSELQSPISAASKITLSGTISGLLSSGSASSVPGGSSPRHPSPRTTATITTIPSPRSASLVSIPSPRSVPPPPLSSSSTPSSTNNILQLQGISSSSSPTSSSTSTSGRPPLLRRDGSRTAGTPRRLTKLDRRPTVVFSGSINRSEKDLFTDITAATAAAEKAAVASPVVKQEDAEKTRTKVIEEIVNTEKDFVNDLVLVSRIFYIPLQEKEIISPKEISGLFSNLTMILGVNSELLKNLEVQRAKPPTESQLGLVFCWMSDFLKVYSIYCNNQHLALKLLDNLTKTNPKFSHFLQEQASHPECRGLHLNSFLIKPVQRITKYPLLLKELLKNTSESHPDYSDIQKALSMLQSILLKINENQRKHENSAKLAEIRKRLVAADKPLISPSLGLIQTDTVNEALVSSQKGGKLIFRKAEYLLFDSIFMRTVEKLGNRKLKVVVHLPIDRLIGLKDVDDDPSNGLKSAFELSYLTDSSEKKTFVVMASSPLAKRNWLLSFATAKSKPKPTPPPLVISTQGTQPSSPVKLNL